jgi:hypothetical protein
VFFTQKDLGRVYVIRLVPVCGTVVLKVGMTHSDRATDRVFEILRSWFNNFRYVPYTQLKLDYGCEDPRDIEQFVHKVLEEYRFEPGKNVQGGTEMFTGVDELKLIHFIRNTEKVPGELTKEEYEIIGRLLAL